MNSIKLSVSGIGHPVSFKNTKMIARGRLITDPKKQKWMEQCVRLFEHQLRCWFLTQGIATAMDSIPLCKIVSSLPLDDSLAWIGSHCVSWRKVEKGAEGAELLIEPLTTEEPHHA